MQVKVQSLIRKKMKVIILLALVSCAFAFRAAVYKRSASCTMNSFNSMYPLRNDLIIRAAKGLPVERTPIWVFRQAGRHLPEYMEYKAGRRKNFLQLLDDPQDVAEITMQPIRRYNLDAAILFSDILVVPEALGMKVEMPGGKGITVPEPFKDPADMKARLPAGIDVKVELKHVMEAVKRIKLELQGKVPLIGFSAAPWTLMYYMVGGSSKIGQENGVNWLRNHPEESKILLNLLTTVVIDYMSAQVDAGADLLQVFEAMGMFIPEDLFYEWAMPCLSRISAELRERHPNIPLLVFPRGASYSLVALQEAGYDVVTLDTAADRKVTRKLLAEAFEKNPDKLTRAASVQGNLDVAHLQPDSSPEKVKAAVEIMLSDFGPQNLIANLGEGLTGKEDPVLVSAFIDSVHEISERQIKDALKASRAVSFGA